MHDPVHMRESPLIEYKTNDGRQVRISERVAAFHRAEQCNDAEMIYTIEHPGGRKERLVFAWPLRYFFRYEVEHLLARCGFREIGRASCREKCRSRWSTEDGKEKEGRRNRDEERSVQRRDS